MHITSVIRAFSTLLELQASAIIFDTTGLNEISTLLERSLVFGNKDGGLIAGIKDCGI
jgi:hypothetical protein